MILPLLLGHWPRGVTFSRQWNSQFSFPFNIQNSPFPKDLVDERVLLFQWNVFALNITNLVEDSFRVAGHGHFQVFKICYGFTQLLYFSKGVFNSLETQLFPHLDYYFWFFLDLIRGQNEDFRVLIRHTFCKYWVCTILYIHRPADWLYGIRVQPMRS